MSTDYRTQKRLLMADLFDGRLASYGISEFIAVPLTQQERAALKEHIKAGIRVEHMELVSRFRFENSRKHGDRCLWDGRNYVWCFAALREDLTPTEYLGYMTRYGDNDPTHILVTIEKVFETEIFDDDQPQYWGFENEEEMVAFMRARAEEREDDQRPKAMWLPSGRPIDL